ncbi:MAG: dihydrofolate reductase [Candidatus Azotimanducaceae bacterium]
MKIALVAAQSENRVIGRGIEIPWRVKGEQALFKRITTGGTLIMGRKTFDSIGRALPGRTTIVVSRNPSLSIEGCEVAGTLDQAIEQARLLENPIYIAGGGQLYEQSIALADTIHLTTIHAEVEGDVYFPELTDEFRLVSEENFTSNIDYTYQVFDRT